MDKDTLTIFRILHKYVNVVKDSIFKSNGKHRHCLYLKDYIEKRALLLAQMIVLILENTIVLSFFLG